MSVFNPARSLSISVPVSFKRGCTPQPSQEHWLYYISEQLSRLRQTLAHSSHLQHCHPLQHRLSIVVWLVFGHGRAVIGTALVGVGVDAGELLAGGRSEIWLGRMIKRSQELKKGVGCFRR